MLRAIETRHAGRKRRYVLRWGVLCGVVLAAVLFERAIATRALPPDGLGWIVYSVHDRLYLPLKGWVWTQWFPYVLVWCVPLAVVAAAISLEYLTKADPVRRVHRAMILRLGVQPWFQRFLARALAGRQIDEATWFASQTDTGSQTVRRFGFARRVVHKEQEALWMQIAVGLAEGDVPDPGHINRVARLSQLRLRLDPSDALAHLRALEVIASVPSNTVSMALAQELERFLGAQIGTAAVAPVLDALTQIKSKDTGGDPDVPTALFHTTTRFAAMTQISAKKDAQPALAFACTALAAFALATRNRHQDIRGFQRLWASARLAQAPDGVADAIAEAETLIFHEMWSKWAEVVPNRAHSDDLMVRALAADKSANLQRIEAAEAFAWDGRQA
jgi:hypothetical protein